MRTKIENTHDPTPETVISLIWDESWLWCVSEGCVEKTTVRRSYLPLPRASVCLLVYLSKKESVAWGLSHPSLLFFLSPEGLVLFYCSLRFSQIQVRRGSCFGEVRAGVREMSSSLCCWSSFQILRSSPFHNFLPRRNPRERVGRGTRSSDPGSRPLVLLRLLSTASPLLFPLLFLV